jgi:hypothetical protein
MKKLTSDIQDLFDDDRYSDLRIVASSDYPEMSYSAHRVIVAARCPKFAEDHAEEIENGIVEIVSEEPVAVEYVSTQQTLMSA